MSDAKDPRLIIRLLREASIFDLFLVSFLLLPFILERWVAILEGFKATPETKTLWILGVVLAYVIGVIFMFIGTSRVRRRQNARDRVLKYLEGKKQTRASFDRIRRSVDQGFTDGFLHSVIAEFPNDLRRSRLKGAKKGIARIGEEDDEGDDA